MKNTIIIFVIFISSIFPLNTFAQGNCADDYYSTLFPVSEVIVEAPKEEADFIKASFTRDLMESGKVCFSPQGDTILVKLFTQYEGEERKSGEISLSAISKNSFAAGSSRLHNSNDFNYYNALQNLSKEMAKNFECPQGRIKTYFPARFLDTEDNTSVWIRFCGQMPEGDTTYVTKINDEYYIVDNMKKVVLETE